jgi:hypothetical protein
LGKEKAAPQYSYRSSRSPDWLKMKNPEAPGVEEWLARPDLTPSVALTCAREQMPDKILSSRRVASAPAGAARCELSGGCPFGPDRNAIALS